jgi:PKD repeat protein
MKRLVFTILTSFLFFSLAAQVDRETVLLEIGTGGWCFYCPGAAMGADDLHANGDPVAIIEYHNGDPFATTESNARNSYYSITGYPTAWFDGSYNSVVGGSNTQSMYGSYKPIVDARMLIQTDFTVEIYGENTGNNYDLTVKVNHVGDYSGGNLKVRVAVTESHIPYTWFGMTEMNFVCRDMVPTETGTDVDFSSSDEQTVEVSFTFDDSWDAEECEIVAFLQDDSGKEVLHSAHVMLNDLEPPAPTFLAGFYADQTDYCETPAVAHFYSDCIGDPTSWNWTFEGGIPETSLDENPVITYLDEGSYDVTLIVSDGMNWDTMSMEKYIGVHGLPDVDWDEVEDICNEDWDPYMLTQGQPEGGVYSGEYVTEGMYFHPTEAGVGQHEVTYTYTDEFGCINSASEMLNVVNCVGVGENEALSLDLFPNPTSGVFTINLNAQQFNNADLKVMDALGKEVFVENGLNVNGTYSTRVDLSAQPQGIYFVVVSGEGQNITKKIFVRH